MQNSTAKYGFRLDDWQQKFLDTKGDKILCCGRQVGKSQICAIDAGEWAINNKNNSVLMIAPTERQAFELFDKTLRFLLDNYRKEVKMGKDRPTKSKITLKNGTRILCLPTGISGVGIRGLTIGRLYVDETAQVPEEIWPAVQPMLLTTGGNMILLSTPHGTQGEFYRCWTNQDGAYDSFTRFSITTETVVRNRPICDSWNELQRDGALRIIDQARARMSNQLFSQEYLGEFVSDLFTYFGDDLIKKCCVLDREEIVSKQATYYLGVDIARLGEDTTVYNILRRTRNNEFIHVDMIVQKKKDTVYTLNKIYQLNEIYNFHRIGIDAGSGSLGVGIYDQLLHNDSTKRKVMAIDNKKRSIDRDGKGKTLMKEDLYDNLRALMQHGKIRLLNDDYLIESLRAIQFEYKETNNGNVRLNIFAIPHIYTDTIESLNRAAIFSQDKHLNITISSIKV